MNNFINTYRRAFTRASYFTLLICLASLSLSAQKKSEREREELKGAVKSVSIKEAKLAKSGDKFVEEKPILNYIFSYDLSGNKTGADYLDNNTGVFLWKWRALYDAAGKLIKFLQYEKNGAVSDRIFYRYNSANLKTGETWYENGRLAYTTRYRYSRENRRVEELSYNSKGRFAYKRIVDYDSFGNVVRESESRYESAISDAADKWVYKYDERGNLTAKLFYEMDGEANRENDNYGYMGKTVYVYDAQEDIVEKAKYDENGIVEEKENYDYKFDLKGNWTERIAYKKSFKDGKPRAETHLKTYRIISYY